MKGIVNNGFVQIIENTFFSSISHVDFAIQGIINNSLLSHFPCIGWVGRTQQDSRSVQEC